MQGSHLLLGANLVADAAVSVDHDLVSLTELISSGLAKYEKKCLESKLGLPDDE